MPTEIVHPYIVLKGDATGNKPIIAGTRTRVSNIIAYYKLGYSPEELVRELPHLNLSQIYDALSYYYEHQKEIDNEINEESEEKLKQLLQK